MSKMKSKRNHLLVLCVMILIVAGCCFVLATNNIYAATKSKSVTRTHIVMMSEAPTIIPIAVEAKDSYQGTYSDSGETRTFTKHRETVTLSSYNDSYLTSQVKAFAGYLKFHSYGKVTKCNHIKCKCTFYIGSPIFKVLHHCSNTKTKAKIGGNAYCVGGYTIRGTASTISQDTKFSKLGK